MSYLENIGKNAKKAFEDLKAVKHSKIIRVLENYNVYRYVLEQRPIKMKNFFKDEPLY